MADCATCNHPSSYHDDQHRCHAPVGPTLSDDCGCGWNPPPIVILSDDELSDDSL
jgi:hypothetical protein